MIYKFQVNIQNVRLDLQPSATIAVKDKLYVKFRFEEFQNIYVEAKSAPWNWNEFKTTFEYSTKFISTLKDRPLLIQCKKKTGLFSNKTLGLAKIYLHTLCIGPSAYVLDICDIDTEEYMGQISFNIIMSQKCEFMHLTLDKLQLGSLVQIAQCVYPQLCRKCNVNETVLLQVDVGYMDNLHSTWTVKPLCIPVSTTNELPADAAEDPIHLSLKHVIQMENFELATVHLKFSLAVVQTVQQASYVKTTPLFVQEIARAVVPLIGNYDVLNPKMNVAAPVLLSKSVCGLLPNRDETLCIAFSLAVKQGPQFAQMKQGQWDRDGATGDILIGFVFPAEDQMNARHPVQFVCEVRPALTLAQAKQFPPLGGAPCLYQVRNEFFQRALNPELNSRGFSRVRRRMSLQDQTDLIERIGVQDSPPSSEAKIKTATQDKTSGQGSVSISGNTNRKWKSHERPSINTSNNNNVSFSTPSNNDELPVPAAATKARKRSIQRNSISLVAQAHPDPLPALDHLLLLAQSGALQSDSARSQEFRGILNFTYNLHAHWQKDLAQLRLDRLEFEHLQSRELITTDEQEQKQRADRKQFIALQVCKREVKERLYEIGLQVLRRRLYLLFIPDFHT